MKKLIQSLFLLMFVAFAATAQDRTITGTVTANDDGLPLPGVTVKISQTNTAVQTSSNGTYQIIVPASAKSLTFSFIGFNTKVVQLNTTLKLDVQLSTNSKQLSEVIVTTSLGIERPKKEIGYATAVVSSEELTKTNAVNVANGLQGKVAGLNITSINSGVFEDVKINLRGIRSLTGNNNPLLLLDGIPSDIAFLSSINPNDIQDVNILKGASAAAIYGPDARNGVIVVTTKKGTKDGEPIITLSHSTQLSDISFFPEFQNSFGNGGYGEFTPYENWSWGPAYDGSLKQVGQVLDDGSFQNLPYSALKDERKNFFNTGTTIQNDISFNAKDFYLSVQDANIKGIVPDDANRRTGIRMNTSREYGKFKVGLNTNYVNQDYSVFDDVAMSDYNTANNVGLNGGLMNLIFNTPAHIPITSYKDFNNNPFADYNGYFNEYGMNPYFALDNWRQEGKRTDLITNLEMNFEATKWLNFTYRAGLTSRNIEERNSSNGEVPTQFGLDRGFTLISGAIGERSYTSKRYSSELFANASKQLNDDFKVSGILGTYLRQTDIRDSRVGAANLVVPELFNVANRTGELTGSSPASRSRLLSFYGSASLSYKGWANIEVTGRNDQTSVLSLANNSFFYPGVSGALVLTDAIPSIQSNILTYLKLRASWNKTGNADISPYSLAATFAQSDGFPYGSLPGYTANNTTYNAALKPEFIESKEVGFETGLLSGIVNLEATYFQQNNDNQIIPISVSSATGYSNAYVNAAAFVNKGIELDLTINPTVNSRNFRAKIGFNATYLESKISDIYDGLDELFIGGFTTAANYAIKGSSAFLIKASDYTRDPQGRVIVDPNTGYPTEDPNLKVYGQTMPKWIIGVNPSFGYKGLNLSILGEYKGGHFAYNDIGNAMAWTGVSSATTYNNRERFVIPNSSIPDLANPGQYIDNTDVTVANVTDFFTGVYRNVRSNFLTSAAAWRLREVALSYEIPQKFLLKQKFIKGINIALTGRNLILVVPKSNVYQDPDFNFTEGNSAGISDSQINPPTRVFGGNITINF